MTASLQGNNIPVTSYTAEGMLERLPNSVNLGEPGLLPPKFTKL